MTKHLMKFSIMVYQRYKLVCAILGAITMAVFIKNGEQ